ncbi:MAG: rRNA pseudouridine synthase [Chloroflexia bacterium]|nr:rRNA pseudouridine synthase [Chloroflexia bacterium]
MRERLQKILARAGLGSRRACEELIRQGRVTVNGQVAHLGQKADPERDRLAVDDKPLPGKPVLTYIALHKPAGVVSTVRDPQGRPTILGLVQSSTRLYPVGRLDLDSEGLILLTNDGKLAQRLMHPRYEHEKEYHVCLEGRPRTEALARWRRGLPLDGRRTAPAEVSVLRWEPGCTWLRVVLHEGRKRQIRRVAEALGFSVQRIIRVRIGPLRLGRLKPSEWRTLNPSEVAALNRVKERRRV